MLFGTRFALSLAVSVASCSSPQAILDTQPPAAVVGLQGTVTFESAVKIQWIATGDDGAQGRPDLYEIRYARFAPQSDSWVESSHLLRVQPRHDAGAIEQVVIAWLEVGKAYWVTIRAADEVGNWSEWSEAVMVSTTNTSPQARLEIRDGPCLRNTADASGCTDAEDSPFELEVRWDWDGDLVWDTPWSRNKVEPIPIEAAGRHEIGLQVRDQGHLTSSTVGALDVRAGAVQIRSVRRAGQRIWMDTCCSPHTGCYSCGQSFGFDTHRLGLFEYDVSHEIGLSLLHRSFVGVDSIWALGNPTETMHFVRVQFDICTATRVVVTSHADNFVLKRLPSGGTVLEGDGRPQLEVLLDPGPYLLWIDVGLKLFRLEFQPTLRSADEPMQTGGATLGGPSWGSCRSRSCRNTRQREAWCSSPLMPEYTGSTSTGMSLRPSRICCMTGGTLPYLSTQARAAS
jgi:hypothetical protein